MRQSYGFRGCEESLPVPADHETCPQKIKGALRNTERPEGSPPPELPNCQMIVPRFSVFVNSAEVTNY